MNINEEWVDSIQCINCLEGIRQLPDKSIDLIIADPPYGISRKLNCEGERLGRSAKLNFNFGEWDEFNKEWFELSVKKTKGWVITFCAKKDIGVFWDILEENKFVAIDALAWVKPDPLPLNAKSRFLNSWEALVVGKRSGAYWGSNYFTSVIQFQSPKGKSRIHPTQKPIGLIKELVRLTTREGDIVLDPFMGSGTTGVVCKTLGRHYIGFEISEEYCALAKERIQNSSEVELLK